MIGLLAKQGGANMERLRAIWRFITARRCQGCAKRIPDGARYCSKDCEDVTIELQTW